MSRGPDGKFGCTPHLPFEPLRRYVASIVETHNPGTRDAGLASLGWTHRTWQNRAYMRGQQKGIVAYSAADRLACDLGMHPAEIWGEAWWELSVESDVA